MISAESCVLGFNGQGANFVAEGSPDSRWKEWLGGILDLVILFIRASFQSGVLFFVFSFFLEL